MKGYNKIAKERTLRLYELAQNFRFKLKFNKNESLYFWEEEMLDDATNEIEFNLAILKGGGRAKYYMNKDENLNLVQFKSPINNNWYIETSLLNNQNWTVLKETDTILGYKVFKAVSNNGDIAWFAPDIPVPFGPLGKGNLPGLILKWDTTKARIIEAVEIKLSKKTLKIKRPQKGIVRTAEEGRKERIRQINHLTR